MSVLPQLASLAGAAMLLSLAACTTGPWAVSRSPNEITFALVER